MDQDFFLSCHTCTPYNKLITPLPVISSSNQIESSSMVGTLFSA